MSKTVAMQQLLFGGQEPAINLKKPLGYYQAAKRNAGYRKARCARWSYECCNNCFFKTQRKRSRTYYKCMWIGVSSSCASDITLGSVCNRWRPENEKLSL